MSEHPIHSPDRSAAPLVRWRWVVRGQVQGVGFRPFVYRVAQQCGLTGYVLNNPTGVVLEVQGSPEALAQFRNGFAAELPPLARVDHVDEQPIAALVDERTFHIAHSQAAGAVEASVTIDSAVCQDCLRELFDPADRRFGHGLINCTHCGPRLSIIRDVPYDRANTTMAAFPMCPDCRREYEDPADRRFHAQPVCCPRCGPQVELVEVSLNYGEKTKDERQKTKDGDELATRVVEGDPYAEVARRLHAGQIVAIKGIGGFHLAVRADDAAAVDRLRRLKHRDTKPFALMCRDVTMAAQLVELSNEGRRELLSPRAPIVLATRKDVAAPRNMLRGAPAPLNMAPGPVAAGVAPGTHRLGVMLPYTPIHHLLWARLAELPGAAAVPALVMTSGNISDEPLVTDNADALRRLGPMCDAILWHDRPIERSVDDSVVLDRGGGQTPLPIRRSRGYVPEPWAFANVAAAATAKVGTYAERDHPTGICLGGELKNTIAIVTQHEIVLSQHFGDLTNALGYQQFQKAIDDLIRLYDVRVDFVAHDLHPQYMSTIAAGALAQRYHAQLRAMQHHHAHAAAVAAEHGLTGPALAIVCDGTGYGTDGTIWGGELLLLEGAGFKRLGRLRPIRLPGGDAAARDTRRPALSLLHMAYGEGFAGLPAARRLVPDDVERRNLATLIRGGFNSPWTSSTGRMFDGVAAFLGLCLRNQHEAQSGMGLEAAAAIPAVHGATECLFEITRAPEAQLWELDLSKLIRVFAEGAPSSDQIPNLSWLFHDQLAWGMVALASRIRADLAPDTPYPLLCSGGVLCNQIFADRLAARAGAANDRPFCTFFHNSYPPTDAGLAFGQAILSMQK